MCPCLHSPWSPPLELPMAFWWWGVLYSFYSFFFKTLHGRWVLGYLFSPQSIILLVHNSTAHGNMACVRSAQQIRWRWGWGDWCGLEDRRAEHVLPATCRPDTTGAALRSPHSTQCGRRGRKRSWSPPHSTACTAWLPSACAASPAAPGSAGSWGPHSCCSSCCSPRPSGASWEGCARFWGPGPPRQHCTEPSWHGHIPPSMFF